MYLNGKKIFATLNNKRTLPIVNGDGKTFTEIDITLTEQTGKSFSIAHNRGNSIIDWGDGTSDSLTSHLYQDFGNYTIKLNCEIGIIPDEDPIDRFFYNYSSIIAARFYSNKLGKYGFTRCENLESVQLSGLERTIPRGAFQNSGIRTIDTKNAESIGVCAFSDCTRLTSVTLGQNLKQIGEFDPLVGFGASFEGCINLVSINLENVELFDGGSFRNCRSLSSISLDSARGIDSSAFEDCRSLTSVTIPSTVTRLSSYVFNNCRSLMTINLPTSIESISHNALTLNSDEVATIYFAGTRDQWSSITKSYGWGNSVTVVCIDD